MNRWNILIQRTARCFSARRFSSKGEICAGLEKFERLWREFFSDPSQWWDNRIGKPNSRFPDFKHKRSGAALWLIDGRNPKWVESEIRTIEPGVSILSGPLRLSTFNKAGQYGKTLELFQHMQEEGMRIDGYFFVHVLHACAALQSLEEGKRIHKLIIEAGCEVDMCVSSSLVDMYAKCGSIDDAWRVFNRMARRDVVCWNAMILGLVKCRQGMKALELFHRMELEKIKPSAVTFVGLLNACASVNALEEGRSVHKQIIRSGWECEEYVANSLVDMYAKCGGVDYAWTVFNKMPRRDVVCWNAMILGLVKCGHGLRALELFHRMQDEGVKPDSVTFVGLLNACASVADFEAGKVVHENVIRSGYEGDIYVGSSLVDMYAKCGSIEDAWKVFVKMPTRNVVAWSAMILGLVSSGQGVKALELFQSMQREGVEANSVTYVAVLSACGSIAALETGKSIHKHIIEAGLELHLYVSTSLVDMYSKCGSLDCAERLFNKMPTRNVSAWNAMIAGYAMHGRAKEAVAVFERMFQAGSDINEVTFTGLLSACSHGGLVKEGMQYFDSMTAVYGVSPTLEHYNCMVDLLGRAGHLDDAEEMVRTMPFEPATAAWMALLGACRIHGNVEMGGRAAKQVLELEPNSCSGHILLSNIYAAANRGDITAVA